jgi:hypothetical protein
VLRALQRCGVRHVEKWSPGPKPYTFAAWLRMTAGKRGGKVFLVVAGNHFQVVSGNRYACGRTNAVVELDHATVKRRALVDQVWRLEAPNGVTVPTTARKPPAKANPASGARYRARKLAAEWGIEIDPDSRTPSDLTFWVYGPAGVYRDEHGDLVEDPCEGSHFCAGWLEASETVQTYVDDLKARGLKPGDPILTATEKDQ